jgi:hypothetical protein
MRAHAKEATRRADEAEPGMKEVARRDRDGYKFGLQSGCKFKASPKDRQDAAAPAFVKVEKRGSVEGG